MDKKKLATLIVGLPGDEAHEPEDKASEEDGELSGTEEAMKVLAHALEKGDFKMAAEAFSHAVTSCGGSDEPSEGDSKLPF